MIRCFYIPSTDNIIADCLFGLFSLCTCTHSLWYMFLKLNHIMLPFRGHMFTVAYNMFFPLIKEKYFEGLWSVTVLLFFSITSPLN